MDQEAGKGGCIPSVPRPLASLTQQRSSVPGSRGFIVVPSPYGIGVCCSAASDATEREGSGRCEGWAQDLNVRVSASALDVITTF